RMAGRNDDSCFDQATDLLGCNAFRSNGDKRAAVATRAEHVDEAVVERLKFRGEMDPASGAAEERPFDMDSEHSWNAAVDRFIDRRYSALNHRRIIADQRWEQSGCAKTAVGGRHDGDGLNRWIVVEKPPAAPIHLRVDEAGKKQLAAEIDSLCALGWLLADGANAFALDEHTKTVPDLIRKHDAAVDESGRHQRVSVTLARCGGWSGSRPRAIARELASL